MIDNLFFFPYRENNLIDLEGAIEENQDFEPQVTQPLQEPSTVTRVASTTLRENFILVDGQVSHNWMKSFLKENSHSYK